MFNSLFNQELLLQLNCNNCFYIARSLNSKLHSDSQLFIHRKRSFSLFCIIYHLSFIIYGFWETALEDQSFIKKLLHKFGYIEITEIPYDKWPETAIPQTLMPSSCSGWPLYKSRQIIGTLQKEKVRPFFGL